MSGKHKKLYKFSGKCDDQQQYKSIIEAAMISSPVECTDNIPMPSSQFDPTKNPGEIKPLRQFSEALDVKHKTDVRS